MLSLKNVTLISVSCVREADSLTAIKFSKKNIDFGAAKLITCADLKDDEVEIVKIPKLNYEEYNKFIVFDLYKYVDTDYALLIQDDGFVVNVDAWKDEFLNYDYIGAPWPLPHDSFSYRDPSGNIIRVGNGGFSLRSKKLMRLPEELKLPWKAYYGFFHEDGFLSVHNRSILEKHGCVFAPLDVAKYFSHEVAIPEVKGIRPFGFHGKGSPYMKLLKLKQKKGLGYLITSLFNHLKK
jgi:hypothetical protein